MDATKINPNMFSPWRAHPPPQPQTVYDAIVSRAFKNKTLNGKCGRRGLWKEHKGRFTVTLDNGQRKGIKPENIELIPRPECLHEIVQPWEIVQIMFLLEKKLHQEEKSIHH